ncbi:MAG: 4Fe-4S binding protein [Actinomycetota bacterium]
MGRKRWQIDTALRLWRLTHWAKRLGGATPFRQAAGLIASDRAFRGSFIPVGESIEIPPSVVAPRQLIEEYVTRACNRTIIDFCPCRTGQGCSDYPTDLGCMLLGRGSMDVDPGVGRRATVEESMAHVDRALGLGLLPLIGHLRVDKTVFGIGDFSKLLTVCFCCRCCCVLRSEMGNLVKAYPDSLVRLEGLTVAVGDGCTGCGVCVPACPIGNVSLSRGLARMGDACLGCGSCASVCPRDCIDIHIEPGAAPVEDLKRRVEAGVDIEA